MAETEIDRNWRDILARVGDTAIGHCSVRKCWRNIPCQVGEGVGGFRWPMISGGQGSFADGKSFSVR